MDPFDRHQKVTWIQCVGGEVRLDLEMTCRLDEDHESVNTKVVAKFFEGATCITDDQEDSQTREQLVGACNGSCTPTPFNFDLDSNDKDKATVTISVKNEQR